MTQLKQRVYCGTLVSIVELSYIGYNLPQLIFEPHLTDDLGDGENFLIEN